MYLSRERIPGYTLENKNEKGEEALDAHVTEFMAHAAANEADAAATLLRFYGRALC